MMFFFKFITSLIFLIDELTMIMYCIYEYEMSPQEAGIVFCVLALCLFIYGITFAGYIIDKTNVKYALMIGFILYSIGKFILIFAASRLQLWLVMVTLIPFGISLIFPTLLLGVKRLTKENARPEAFSFFYGFMIAGAVFAGPIVDWIRHDYKTTTWDYHHTNKETG